MLSWVFESFFSPRRIQWLALSHSPLAEWFSQGLLLWQSTLGDKTENGYLKVVPPLKLKSWPPEKCCLEDYYPFLLGFGNFRRQTVKLGGSKGSQDQPSDSGYAWCVFHFAHFACDSPEVTRTATEDNIYLCLFSRIIYLRRALSKVHYNQYPQSQHMNYKLIFTFVLATCSCIRCIKHVSLGAHLGLRLIFCRTKRWFCGLFHNHNLGSSVEYPKINWFHYFFEK